MSIGDDCHPPFHRAQRLKLRIPPGDFDLGSDSSLESLRKNQIHARDIRHQLLKGPLPDNALETPHFMRRGDNRQNSSRLRETPGIFSRFVNRIGMAMVFDNRHAIAPLGKHGQNLFHQRRFADARDPHKCKDWYHPSPPTRNHEIEPPPYRSLNPAPASPEAAVTLWLFVEYPLWER